MNIEKLFSDSNGPVVATPGYDSSIEALCEFSNHSSQLSELVAKHGAVLFRGFGLKNHIDFDFCAKGIGGVPFQYIGGNSPRTHVGGDVFTSTEYPASEAISLHNEMSYLREWPRRLFFYSQVPAESGGQTSLASSRQILDALPSSVVDRFRERKLSYVRNFPFGMKVGKSWQVTYQTEDRDELALILEKQHSTCEWTDNGSLKVRTLCDATTIHPELGIETWFNQAEQWHPSALHPDLRRMFEGRGLLAHNCEHGDGSPLDEEMLQLVRETTTRHKLLFNWQHGDFLVLDNITMMHGRESFKGKRTTLAFLSAA